MLGSSNFSYFLMVKAAFIKILFASQNFNADYRVHFSTIRFAFKNLNIEYMARPIRYNAHFYSN